MYTSRLLTLFVSVAVFGTLFGTLYFVGKAFVPNLAGQQEAAPAVPDAALLNGRLPYFDLPGFVGDRARSSDFTDTPLVIMFWSTWNTPAADEMHILDRYLAGGTVQSSLVKIIAINTQEERSVASSFLERGRYTVQTLLDAQGIVGERYEVKSLPTFYFVDRTGVIREIYVGALSQTMLINKIEKILP